MKRTMKLEAWVSELEQRTREMTLLNDMGDILRACFTLEEAYNVIVRVAQQIFPVQVGALYVIAPSRNSVESVAVWGDPALAERVFSPQECWALRRGRTALGREFPLRSDMQACPPSSDGRLSVHSHDGPERSHRRAPPHAAGQC